MRKELAYTSIGALFVTAQVLTSIRAEVFPFLPEPYNLMFGGLFAYILIYCVAMWLNNYLYNSRPERNLIAKYMLAIGAAQSRIPFNSISWVGGIQCASRLNRLHPAPK